MTVRYWISSLRGNGAKPAGRVTRAEAVRRFHESVPGYEKSPLGALLALMQEDALDEARKAFKLGPEAVVLLINTEGATDPENYRKIVGRN